MRGSSSKKDGEIVGKKGRKEDKCIITRGALIPSFNLLLFNRPCL
jgi:hypothetical protein